MLKHKKVIVILLAAYFIRMIALNQSFWLDEAVTAKVALHFNFADIITKFSPTDFHPPFYYLFMKFWTNVFGYSEVALRMPSVIFSILAGWILYLVAGFWPMVFFLFNPLVVYYSQEARMYMMTVFLLTMVIYSFKKLLLGPAKSFTPANARLAKSEQDLRVVGTPLTFATQQFLLFILFCVLSFYTFYGSIFLIATIFIYLLYKKQLKTFFMGGLLFVIFTLPLTPLIYKQLFNSRAMLQSIANWSLVLGKANLKDLLLIPMKFAFGRISFYPKSVYYLLSGLWTTIIFYFVVKGGIKKKFWLFLFTFPLLVGFTFSFFSPMLQYFRFLYLLPILSAMLFYGLPQRSRYNLRGCYLVTGGFVILSLVYLLMPQFHREDWQSLAYYLPPAKQVYMISSSSDGLTYYRPDIQIKDLRDVKNIYEKEIIIIPYTAEIYGLDYKKRLEAKGYQLKEKKSFRELYYEVWTTSFFSYQP